MNKSMIAGAVVILVAAIAGVGVYLLQNLDGIVKDLIEQVGTEVLKTDVRVAEVELDLSNGAATLKGLTIANPKGFSSEKLFSMDSITVAIDTTSLAGPVYVINEISVDGLRVLAEQKGTTSNVQTLLDGMSGTGDSGDTAAEEAGSTEEIRLAIKAINFSNGNLKLISDMSGPRDLKLPTFKLRNLGTPEHGLNPEELGTTIAKQMLRQVTKAVSKALEDAIKEAAEGSFRKKLGSFFKKGDE